MIHRSHWQYLRFALRSPGELIVYQWKILPFGSATALSFYQPFGSLSSSPAFAGMSDVPDIFHAQASANQTARTRDISLRCHFKLGFIINLTKSAFVPSQVMLHLGAPINTARGLVFPSPASGRSNNSCISSIVRPNPGLCSMPSAGDRAVGFLPCSCPPLHVLSSSSVKSPERSLRHEGRSHFEADPLVISSDLVSSGTLVSPGSCVPRRSSSTPYLSPFPT